MQGTRAWMTAVGVLALCAAGCDFPPSPPLAANGRRVKSLDVTSGGPEEIEAATAVKAARANYLYRLQVLASYYERLGNMDKLLWARREMENLQGAQTFTFDGAAEVTPPEGESLAGVREPLLVERVVAARKDYLVAVAALAALYEGRNDTFKARMVRNMQLRLDPVHVYMYVPSGDVPDTDIEPVEVIPEADAMYAEAVALHEQGKGLLRIFVTTNYRNQRKALVLLRNLVRKCPRSTKVALAAYYIGEIYKEYFNEDVLAVQWYERAWTWDPNIPKPARFQCATVYDIRLQDRAKAVQCYELAIKYEQFNPSNVRYSHQRIRELMAQ